VWIYADENISDDLCSISGKKTTLCYFPTIH